MPIVEKMLDTTLLARFWKDFQLVTQEVDPSFPIVNPQDAIRVLIKCRNWVGTFTELLINITNLRSGLLASLKHERFQQAQIDQYWYAELLGEGHSVSALKTKELAQALIAQKTKDDPTYHKIQADIRDLETELETLNSDKETLDLVLKRLEKTTDWLRDYLNWCKYEARVLQN